MVEVGLNASTVFLLRIAANTAVLAGNRRGTHPSRWTWSVERKWTEQTWFGLLLPYCQSVSGQFGRGEKSQRTRMKDKAESMGVQYGGIYIPRETAPHCSWPRVHLTLSRPPRSLTADTFHFPLSPDAPTRLLA